MWFCCQPLYEAVSWNSSLLHLSVMLILSASLWGCELKYCYTQHWFETGLVSLFMRLWVEICKNIRHSGCGWSASLWGCELKWVQFIYEPPGVRQPLYEAVSWNVVILYPSRTPVRSASLWGCELKYSKWTDAWAWSGQPLYEAVSWNNPLQEISESTGVSLFMRLWVEIPEWWKMLRCLSRQPLYEAVSWNMDNAHKKSMHYWSASLWGCELKYRNVWCIP